MYFKHLIMKRKFFLTTAIFLLLSGIVYGQNIKNTSYTTHSGERVLRLECTLPVSITEAWQSFTLDGKLKKWMAPLAHIELRSGGYILTNYDTTKKLSDSSSIGLPIMSFIENELLVLKVNLNNHFVKSVRESDGNLQEIIQFKKIGENHTKIVSSMIGWGVGPDWEMTYDFFLKGNLWTYEELLKNYKLN